MFGQSLLSQHSGAQREPQATPFEQLIPQRPFSHTAEPPLGTGHGRHAVPQVMTLLSSTHIPLQSCFPLGQMPLHAWSGPMHAPAQSFLGGAHDAPHCPPLHVAEPPDGTGHGSHILPHVSGDVSLTHFSSHSC